MAKAVTASTPDHRLNVPNRPIGSSPIPAAASNPGARDSSALTAGPAERNARQALDAHVGAGHHGDRSVVHAGRQAAEHVGAAPRPVAPDQPQAHVPRLLGGAPRLGDRRAGEERVEVGLVAPHGEQCRPARIGGRPGVHAAAGAEETPDVEALDVPEVPAVGCEVGHRRRGAVGAHEVERPDAGHRSDMLASCVA